MPIEPREQAVLAAVRQVNVRLRPWVEGRVKRLGAWVLPAALTIIGVPAIGLGWWWLPVGAVAAAVLVWTLNRTEISRTARRLREEALAAARKADPSCDEARLRAICAARPWGVRIFPTDAGIAHRILVALGLPGEEMARRLHEADGVADPDAARPAGGSK